MAERNTDSVPAMLTPGEFVITDKAVENAGGPGFFYWLMNILDPSSKKAREDGYQFGGSVLGSLLSRIQEKDEGPVYPKSEFTIPAGKNILGQPTEKMGAEELMGMITQGGGAAGVLKKGAGVLKEGVGAMKYGKYGIEEFMAKPTRRKGLEAMGKFMTTGKGQKEILENARLEVQLEELKKWAIHKGLFEKVVQKQQGGEVPETLLSMISGGKYGTSKDLPSIREQIIPALELLTGAEHVPEGESAGLTDLALAIPFLGKFGKGAKAAKPAMSKYYASLFGGKKVSEKKVKKYLEKMFSEETIGAEGSKIKRAQKVWKESKTPPFGLREVDAPKKVLAKQSPSVSAIGSALQRRGTDYTRQKGMSKKEFWDEHFEDDYQGLLKSDASKVSRGVKSFIKEAQGAYKKYYGKQRGGSIDDYSLMDYMMPAMDKRLGPSLKKFQSGGSVPQPGDPNYYAYMQQQGQTGAPPGQTQPAPGTGTPYGGGTSWTVPTAPTGGAQSQLIQPSDIYSTGIGSIFGEMGLQTPGSEYLENIQAYDPKQQRRMQQDLSRKMPGPMGGAGGFAGSGAAIKKAGEQREEVTQQYTRGSEDLRKQYREQIMQDVLADMAAGTYEFEDLG